MAAGPTAAFLAELGGRVRARRQAQGLTVARLAELSGVSRRMLTSVELGQANPSLVTVDKIARALDTDFAGVVLADRDVDVLTVRSADSATPVWTTGAGSCARLHVGTRDRGGPELWSWTLVPGDRYTASADPDGSEELFLVQSGTLLVEADGAAPTRIPAGASARLASDRAYAYASGSDEPVHFVRVVHIRAPAR